MLCTGLQGKLLKVSQGRYSFLHLVAWKTAASLGLCTVCWMGCVFAERTERKPKTKLKPAFHHHYSKVVQNKWFRWVGMVCFLPLQENVFCSARNHLSAVPHSEVQCRYAPSTLWKVSIFSQLAQPSQCPNVSSLSKKSTLPLFRVIPIRTCKPRHVSLNPCCECSLQHRHVPCPLRRNDFDQGGGGDAAVRVGVENAPLQSEVHL